MSTSSSSGKTGTAPNLCVPQPFVTIYIVNNSEKDTETKAAKPLILTANSNKDTGAIDSRLTALAITDANSPKFLVHKNIICHHSPYFSAAFNGSFIEGRTQTMAIDVDEKAFGILVNWLYNQVIVSETGGNPSMVPLARLWIMAEEFLMPELQDQAMKELHTVISSNKNPSCYKDFGHFTEIAFQHGNGENPLVELGLWTMTWCLKGFMKNHIHRIPQGMLVKAFMHLKEANGSGDNGDFERTRDVSTYYVIKKAKK